MYGIIKPFLFILSAEKAHHLTTYLLNIISRFGLFHLFFRKPKTGEKLSREVFGIRFPNPIGLAAGFDKNGDYIEAMSKLGFGFIEVGTVTPKAQKGNPRPRLFRLINDKAIINRMGFNNKGVDYLVDRLKRIEKSSIVIGGNIGKNKLTPNQEAWKDYLICFQKLYPYVDYFVVNLSSPNTPGLRNLQEKGPLSHILSTLIEERSNREHYKPILLKIAPDMTSTQLDDVVEIVDLLKIDGIIATNTTISRESISASKQKIDSIGNGGLSGNPLQKRSTEVIREIRSKSDIPIIGVGGIHSVHSGREKFVAGADLIQCYTGLIYRGPSLIRDIIDDLIDGPSK